MPRINGVRLGLRIGGSGVLGCESFFLVPSFGGSERGRKGLEGRAGSKVLRATSGRQYPAVGSEPASLAMATLCGPFLIV
jgi:hypothetical protein